MKMSIARNELTKPGYADTPTSHVTAQLESIGPLVAKKYLESMASNRRVKDARVRQYASAMKRGQWTISDPISFDCNGLLINGQHRLLSVIKTGMVIEFLVVRGLPPESKKHLDIGVRRSINDILKMNGVSNPSPKSAMARVILCMENGLSTPIHLSGTRYEPTVDDIVERASTDPVVEECAKLVTGKYKPLAKLAKSQGAIGWFMYCLKNGMDDFELASEFLQIAMGTMLPKSETDPAYVLHKRLTRTESATNTSNSYLRMALVIKAWNMFVTGTQTTKLFFRTVGVHAEPFPQILLDREIASAGYKREEDEG
jgi:hypothetical protein